MKQFLFKDICKYNIVVLLLICMIVFFSITLYSYALFTHEEVGTNSISLSFKKPRFNLANNWKDYTENENNFLALYTLNTKELSNVKEYNGKEYTLTGTPIDVSEQRNGKVVLGEYKNGSDVIAVIGQDGGVVAPEDSSKLFSMRSAGVTFLTMIDLSNLNTSNVTNMYQMFAECIRLSSLDLSSFDTSNVIDMSGMFRNCGLKSLDLSSFDTSNVTNMSGMFILSSNLANLDLSGWNTSNVTNMGSMFGMNKFSSLDLSSFDTSNVTNMNGMFQNCGALKELNLGSNFNTSNVTDMSRMFLSCGLKSLDLSLFDTSKVTNMSGMFQGCDLVSLDLSSFDTSKVTNMSQMFMFYTASTNLDLSTFDTSNVTDMSQMFFQSSNLDTIIVGCKWNTDRVTNTTDMFTNCPAGNITIVCNE